MATAVVLINFKNDNSALSQQILTVQMKFEAVLVTVAVAEEDDALRDFTNRVHIRALNRKTRRNEEARARLTT